jgi:hypothetical protein
MTYQKSQKSPKTKKIKPVFSGFFLQLTEPNRIETSRFKLVLIFFKKINLIIFLDKNWIE